MEFLAVLSSALLLNRPELKALQRDGWLDWLLNRLQALPQASVLAPFLGLLLPALLCHLIYTELLGRWFGLLELAFLIGLLAWSIGRDQSESHDEYFRTVRHDDEQAAYNRAGEWIDNASYENFNDLHLAVERDFLWQRVDRWFGMIFWFIALGPVGALLYRLLQLIAQRFSSLEELRDLSRWLPARAAVLSFAIVGNFDAVVNRWSSHSNGSDADFVWRQACAALGLPSQVEQHEEVAQREALMQSLLHRCRIFWVVIIALVAILI